MKCSKLVQALIFICFVFNVPTALSMGTAKREPKEIKIGAILPLTGSAALLGTETKEGIDIAIEEINSVGGINGSQIKMIYHDSQNDPKEGVSAFRVLTDIEKISVVISSMSSVTKAIIPIANEKKVVLMATVTAAPKITELSEWVFRNYYTTDIQGEVLSSFIVNKLNMKKVGILYLNDDYGVTGYEVLKKALKVNNGMSVAGESYEKTEVDLRSQISKLKESKPDGICIIAYDNALVTALKQIKESKVEAKIFSYSGLADPKVLQLAGEAAEGVYLTVSNYDPSHPTNGRQEDFVEKYRKRFGKLPGHYPAFGYDTAMIIIEAIRKNGVNPEELKNALLNISDIDLVFGKISILPTREILFPQTLKIIRAGYIMPITQ